MAKPIDYSRTERIVLVIDLHPLFVLQNPKAYLTSIVASLKRLLNFPPLRKSLCAYRLFFSSLSPLRSASVVHRLLPNLARSFLSFDYHSQTLEFLVRILNSLSIEPFAAELSGGKPLALHTAGSLLQLVHDYSWDADLGTLTGKGIGHFPPLRPNLVVLFSPVCCSICSLSDYVNVDVKSLGSCDPDELLKKICNVFGDVNDAFSSRDIHFSWVNVKYEEEGNGNDFGAELGVIEKGIRNLGFGFCSTDSVVLGSALIPFRLIYPNIGVPVNFLNITESYKRSDVQLSLHILDINGKPLECNFCDLELHNLKVSCNKSNNVWSSSNFRDPLGGSEAFWHGFSDGAIKLCVKAVKRPNEVEKIPGSSSDIILVKELSGETKEKRKSSNELFADRVLDLLSRETIGASICKPIPIWQIILSFLCSEGYWALVSLSNSNGDEVLGILKPFTSHSALLSILSSDRGIQDCYASHNGKIENLCAEASNSNGLVGSQTETSTSGAYEAVLAGKKKKDKKHLSYSLPWASYCNAASECTDFDLSDIYFDRKFEKNKKLKFLKCWMKQIPKYSQQHPQMLSGLKSAGNQSPRSPNYSSEQPKKQEEARTCSYSETTGLFFNNISERVQLGLESGVNVQTLAEQLVKSSTLWLLQTCEENGNAHAQDPELVGNPHKSLSSKLTDLLLSDPKEMHCGNECDSSSKSCNPTTTTEMTVKRYELQIFLRMEILRSFLSASIEEPLKQKLLKQICSFLYIIQFYIEGGFHGNVSLYDYVERSIKARYIDALEDIVKDIYNRMDLLPFGDEDETGAFLFNSEDSSQSWRDKEKCDRSESQDVHQSFSVEDEKCQHREMVDESSEGIPEEEPEHKLSEARARRERARRFMSFTSWIPDLQRVWAPKQHKGVNGKPDSLHKESKRKDRQVGSRSVVYETPLSGRKRPCSQDEESKDPGNFSYSVSKALFQED
ncbi:OLC1v1027550C1 [Oldenlandia corymbosa var. corymbosa]|uniref:OLC1v1027550C1 n=1 Tax=Oldenlandia corymbosa var. corymbosa TaxID=529605 RepID=A0AAV1CBM4_OLDCO|nr:OLC1v1027550C1 [Oldenlandia corymbosa var. corymbosa]